MFSRDTDIVQHSHYTGISSDVSLKTETKTPPKKTSSNGLKREEERFCLINKNFKIN